MLAVAVLLGTSCRGWCPRGGWRRWAEDLGIILGCAAPALALVARYLQHRAWPGAAVIAVAYGGFYLIRMRQLRRADRDGVRRLLGLEQERHLRGGAAAGGADRAAAGDDHRAGGADAGGGGDAGGGRRHRPVHGGRGRRLGWASPRVPCAPPIAARWRARCARSATDRAGERRHHATATYTRRPAASTAVGVRVSFASRDSLPVLASMWITQPSSQVTHSPEPIAERAVGADGSG